MDPIERMYNEAFSTEPTVDDVLSKTDWQMLAEQKQALFAAVMRLSESGQNVEPLEGILNWIDALQDAAEASGYPVVYLTDDEPEEDEA